MAAAAAKKLSVLFFRVQIKASKKRPAKKNKILREQQKNQQTNEDSSR